MTRNTKSLTSQVAEVVWCRSSEIRFGQPRQQPRDGFLCVGQLRLSPAESIVEPLQLDRERLAFDGLANRGAPAGGHIDQAGCLQKPHGCLRRVNRYGVLGRELSVRRKRVARHQRSGFDFSPQQGREPLAGKTLFVARHALTLANCLKTGS
jgi:hypothetical protein